MEANVQRVWRLPGRAESWRNRGTWVAWVSRRGICGYCAAVRLRLWHQLFLLNALLVIAALAGVLLVQQQAFRRGLLDYLSALDRQRATAVAGVLARHYREVGSWEALRQRPRVWLALVGAGLEREGLAPGEDDRLPGEAPPPPPPRAGDPPPRAQDRLAPQDDFLPRRPGGPPPPAERPPPRRPGGMDLAARLILLDLQDGHVGGAGLLEHADFDLPIEVDGQVVGHLKLTPLPRLRGEEDVAFVRQQAWVAAGAGGVALVLALLASVALGTRVLRPLQQVTEGARRLAAGDFSARVAAGGGEIGALAHDFNRLALALEQASQARRQWIADISHELRTPLAILRGEIHALEDGIRPYTPAAIASLRVETERLGALIDDLYQLALADVGALAYRLEPLDLGALLRDAAAGHAALLRERGLALQLQLPEEAMLIEGDAQRLSQLWDNLFANAARYSDAGGCVRVQAQRLAKSWLIHVDDTPPGVAEADLPRLFERLFRSDASRSRSSGGAGLGLAICKSIVTAHAGDIVAAPSPLGGLRISVRLPQSGAGT
jgi:two-component system, OmpR family, sensor histidine kinase BaeS